MEEESRKKKKYSKAGNEAAVVARDLHEFMDEIEEDPELRANI